MRSVARYLGAAVAFIALGSAKAEDTSAAHESAKSFVSNIIPRITRNWSPKELGKFAPRMQLQILDRHFAAIRRHCMKKPLIMGSSLTTPNASVGSPTLSYYSVQLSCQVMYDTTVELQLLQKKHSWEITNFHFTNESLDLQAPGSESP